MILKILLAALGALIALYMIIVHKKKTNNPDYKPVCDISDKVSCTKVFDTPYAKVFGISNAYLGLAMYILLIIFEYFGLRLGTQVLSGAGVAISIYLASGLVKHKIVCLVCIASYSIITAIFLLSIL